MFCRHTAHSLVVHNIPMFYCGVEDTFVIIDQTHTICFVFSKPISRLPNRVQVFEFLLSFKLGREQESVNPQLQSFESVYYDPR